MTLEIVLLSALAVPASPISDNAYSVARTWFVGAVIGWVSVMWFDVIVSPGDASTPSNRGSRDVARYDLIVCQALYVSRSLSIVVDVRSLLLGARIGVRRLARFELDRGGGGEDWFLTCHRGTFADHSNSRCAPKSSAGSPRW